MSSNPNDNPTASVPATVPATPANPSNIIPGQPARPLGTEAIASEEETDDDLRPLTDEDIKLLETGPAGTSVTHFERTGPAEEPKIPDEVVQASMSERDRQLQKRPGLRAPNEQKAPEK